MKSEGQAATRVAFRALCGIAAAIVAANSSAAEPRVLVDGYKLERIAQEPDIVTPIGMSFDPQGRLLVVESHTHFRPDGYLGPTGDRIRLLADSDGDGRPDRWTTFSEGYQRAMNVLAREDGGVYVVTRGELRLARDRENDGKADDEWLLVKLDTTADYPHNAMSGLAIGPGPDGAPSLFLGVGENAGVDYTLVDRDDGKIPNTGGVGTIYRMDLEGRQAERWATGFWNPFGLCRHGGRLLCIDNDPDSSPPCRLIDVRDRGDYGFRYEFTRSGVHPLQAWNGELPGALPMVCGVGEGPTAIVSHRGWVWVTSWGDHRIERYDIGTSDDSHLTAKRTVVVQGDENFRPTGMAVAPDGSLYFGDWVDRSYNVHGKGRIWRLLLPADAQAAEPLPPVRLGDATDEVPAGVAQLQRLRWKGTDEKTVEDALRHALTDDSSDVRLYAVRWIADDRIAALRDDVAKLLDGEISSERYFLAVLSALEWLDGDKSMRNSKLSDGLLVRELKNAKRPDALHALALRLVSPDDPWLTTDRLRDYLGSNDKVLRLEAVRTLALRSDQERFAVLAEIADDSSLGPELRAEALTGLAPAFEANAELLAKVASDADPSVAREAQRVLRLAGKGSGVEEAKPPAAELDSWNELLATGGDPASGRRLFFTSVGPRCAVCHTHGGRGGRIGPDLTRLGAQQSRERIIASILQPSREIAPEFQSWTLATDDGLTHAGLRLPEGGDDGSETYADGSGQRFTLASETIAERTPSDASIMPDGLDRTLTVQDLRDLVEFLASGK